MWLDLPWTFSFNYTDLCITAVDASKGKRRYKSSCLDLASLKMSHTHSLPNKFPSSTRSFVLHDSLREPCFTAQNEIPIGSHWRSTLQLSLKGPRQRCLAPADVDSRTVTYRWPEIISKSTISTTLVIDKSVRETEIFWPVFRVGQTVRLTTNLSSDHSINRHWVIR